MEMTLKSRENSFGAWAFLAGVILAILIGISTSSIFPLQKIIAFSPQIYAILVVFGLFVGFSIPISGKDSQAFPRTRQARQQQTKPTRW